MKDKELRNRVKSLEEFFDLLFVSETKNEWGRKGQHILDDYDGLDDEPWSLIGKIKHHLKECKCQKRK